MRAAALLAALGLAGCVWENADPMRVQQKYQAYRPSGFFADGSAMRMPPEGTVPQERTRGSYALLSGHDGQGYVQVIPLPLTRPLLDTGRHDFTIYCAACHGRLGDGNSAVARKMSLRKPPALLDLHLPPGRYFEIIGQGYGLMPSYASELPVKHRWAVVAYLLALQRSQRATIHDLPLDIAAELRKEPR